MTENKPYTMKPPFTCTLLPRTGSDVKAPKGVTELDKMGHLFMYMHLKDLLIK